MQNIRFSSLFASPAVKSEEKRMFSQATRSRVLLGLKLSISPRVL